jgi:hypothetical protein
LVSFYDLCGHLRNVGIDVGVALPCVKIYSGRNKTVKIKDKLSKDVYINRNHNNERESFRFLQASFCDELYQSREFRLIIKSSGSERTFDEKDIEIALDYLRICLGKVSKNERIFWEAYGEIKGIDIVVNKNNCFNLNKIISIMKEANNIIVRNPTSMRSALQSQDGKIRFFVPIDGLNTVKDSMRLMLYLKDSNLITGIEWNVGSLGLSEYNSVTNIIKHIVDHFFKLYYSLIRLILGSRL